MIGQNMLRWRLEELASREWQETVWLAKRKGVMSTFDEAVCGVFSDSRLGVAMDSGYLRRRHSSTFCGKVEELHGVVHAIYAESESKDCMPEDMLDHSEMERMRRLAAELLDLLPREGLS